MPWEVCKAPWEDETTPETCASLQEVFDACGCTIAERSKQHELKGEETGVVSQVSVVGSGRETDLMQASIKMRFNRNPVSTPLAWMTPALSA